MRARRRRDDARRSLSAQEVAYRCGGSERVCSWQRRSSRNASYPRNVVTFILPTRSNACRASTKNAVMPSVAAQRLNGREFGMPQHVQSDAVHIAAYVYAVHQHSAMATHASQAVVPKSSHSTRYDRKVMSGSASRCSIEMMAQHAALRADANA